MKPYGEIFLIDLDGTLTKDVCWTPDQVRSAQPEREMVEKVNYFYRFHFIVIYTARRDYLIEATLEWLRGAGVCYHAISNIKVPGSFYVDDKAVTLDQFLELKMGETPDVTMG